MTLSSANYGHKASALDEVHSQQWTATEQRSDRQTADVELLENLSRWLDDAFHIPHTNLRFGLDPLLGLIPGVGDSVATAAAIYILLAATRLGLPRITIVRMALNIAVDYLCGSIPIIGDLFDVWWKANRRNMDLLRQRVVVEEFSSRTARWHDWAFVVGIILVLLLVLAGSIVAAMWLLQMTWQFAVASL